MNKKALADEEADVKMTAFMMEGKAGIPADWMAMTQGELLAPTPPAVKLGLSELTVTPMASDPRT